MKELVLLLAAILIMPAFSFAQCTDSIHIGAIDLFTSCYGDNVLLSAGGVGAGWSVNIYKDSISLSSKISDTGFVIDTLNSLPTIVYYATADSTGCSEKKDSIVINVHPLPVVSISPHNPSICLGDTVQLICGGGGNGNTYQWSPSTTLSNPNICNPIAEAIGPTSYTLTETNAFGCANHATTTVSVNPFLQCLLFPVMVTPLFAGWIPLTSLINGPMAAMLFREQLIIILSVARSEIILLLL